MINFTVGPVQSSEAVRAIGAEHTPYFRTPEFSDIMLENEAMMKEMAGATEASRVVFLTGSGTAAMEASVINTLSPEDRALIVNGGGFGARFTQLCTMHGVPCEEIRLEAGKTLTEEDLAPFDGKGFTAFIVNIHETSTGVLYDIGLISEFCRKNNLFLIVDAISSFLCDPIDMAKFGIDVMIVGSQKALAVPPGVSILVLGEKALERISRIDSGCMYLDLEDALNNGVRGQTPFTPAVTTLLQIHQRLKEIRESGGREAEIRRIGGLAEDFRSRVKDLPFEFFSNRPSNAVTTLRTPAGNAKEIFTVLKDEYEIWICPNGGEIGDYIFRVGHIGALTEEDNTALIRAMSDMKDRGIIR